MAKKVREKKKKTTVQKYNFWKRWQIGLGAAKYAAPAVPFGVVLGLNWDSWVKEPSEGWSIGVGFGMLIVATIAGVMGIWKKDEIAKSKFSGIFYVSIVLIIVGFAFKLLASMMNEMGDMFLYVALGVVGSGVIDQVDKSAISAKVNFYKQLIEENGLSASAAKKMDDTEQAKEEGIKAKEKRAERVRFIPHD